MVALRYVGTQSTCTYTFMHAHSLIQLTCECSTYIKFASPLQGSYGRLGLGNSDSQSTLKEISTFPPGTVIRRMASSRGSDGHSQAISNSGDVYSWGDG